MNRRRSTKQPLNRSDSTESSQTRQELDPVTQLLVAESAEKRLKAEFRALERSGDLKKLQRALRQAQLPTLLKKPAR